VHNLKKTTLGELIANAISHGLGALFAIVGLVLLIIKSNTTTEVLSSIAFGTSMIVLYLSSTLFHSFPERMKRVYSVFQRLDHSSIFILISGTYTPFLVLLVRTKEAYILLIILWTITVFGIVFKSIWIDKFKYVHLAIYLIMGWSIVFIINEVYYQVGDAFLFVLLGGISYTVGVAFYVAKFKYNHFVWHLFVLGGTVFHFIAVYGYLL
jgi:hemolysin III